MARKYTKVLFTSEIENVVDDLLHQCVAVKSGIYQNIGWGNITQVEVPKKIPRKDLPARKESVETNTTD
jgi:hypothetical protein